MANNIVQKALLTGQPAEVIGIRFPKHAKIFKAGMVPGSAPGLWFTHDPSEKIYTKRYFKVVCDDVHLVPEESTYIGSWFEAALVFHVFELDPACEAVKEYKALLIEALKEETEID